MIDRLLPLGDLAGKNLPAMEHPFPDLDMDRNAGPSRLLDECPDIGEEEFVGAHLDIEPGEGTESAVNR
jgi:hypothetical protein